MLPCCYHAYEGINQESIVLCQAEDHSTYPQQNEVHEIG